MRFRLACPACGGDGSWLVGAVAETWTAPDGHAVPVAAGECDRCGSLVLLVPTDDAVERIAARERERAERRTRARRAMAQVAGG